MGIASLDIPSILIEFVLVSQAKLCQELFVLAIKIDFSKTPATEQVSGSNLPQVFFNKTIRHFPAQFFQGSV